MKGIVGYSPKDVNGVLRSFGIVFAHKGRYNH